MCVCVCVRKLGLRCRGCLQVPRLQILCERLVPMEPLLRRGRCAPWTPWPPAVPAHETPSSQRPCQARAHPPQRMSQPPPPPPRHQTPRPFEVFFSGPRSSQSRDFTGTLSLKTVPGEMGVGLRFFVICVGNGGKKSCRHLSPPSGQAPRPTPLDKPAPSGGPPAESRHCRPPGVRTMMSIELVLGLPSPFPLPPPPLFPVITCTTDGLGSGSGSWPPTSIQ